MSARLQQHFQQLREELAADTPLDADDRAALLELMQEIDLKLAKELASDPDATLVDGVTTTLVTLVGYSTMAGLIGGGGLGRLAYNYGYQRFQLEVMVIVLIILVLLVYANGNDIYRFFIK